MSWLAFIRQFLPHPPDGPRPPDVTILPCPRALTFVPHGRTGWASAMAELQGQVNTFCGELKNGVYWLGMKDWAPIGVGAGVLIGLVVGLYLGIMLPVWLKARDTHATTSA